MSVQYLRRFTFHVFLIIGAGVLLAGASRGATADRAPLGRIAGRVLDAKGKPIAGALLSLRKFDSEERRWTESSPAARSGERGEYEFRGLADGWYVVTADATGFAKAFRTTQLETGQQLSVDVGLREPVRSAILVRDEGQKPVAGARIRYLVQRGPNGKFQLQASDQKTFGMTLKASDKDGRLELPPLPEGTTITVTIDHDDFAPAQLKVAAIAQDQTLTATLHRGVTLNFRFQPEEFARRISDVEIDLRHEPFQHPSTIVFERIPVADAVARVTVEPGSYRMLRMEHPDYLITPPYQPDFVHGNFLQIGPGKNEQFTFELHRKIVVRGRVINEATGKPVVGSDVQGEIGTPVPPSVGKTFSPGWMHAGWGKTDRSGEYRLALAAGPARVSLSDSNLFTREEHVNVVVAADGSLVIPDIRAGPLPKVSGRVVGPDGRPIPKTIVRFRGKLEFLQPTLADDSGRFEIRLDAPLVHLDTSSKKEEPPRITQRGLASLSRNQKKRKATTDHTDSTDKKADEEWQSELPRICLVSSSVSSVKSVVPIPFLCLPAFDTEADERERPAKPALRDPVDVPTPIL